MPYTERKYKQGSPITLGQSSNAVVLLIAINAIAYILLTFIKSMFFLRYEDNAEAVRVFHHHIMGLFVLPSNWSAIGQRPWTLVTQMFVHDSMWQVFSNMLWLWVFGYIMQDLTGNRKIFPAFFYGGLVGGLAFVGAMHALPAFQPLAASATTFGASAGIMAVAVATTTLCPGYRIFPLLRGGIPLWTLTAFYVLIDLTTIPLANKQDYIVHLAGAVTGFLFMLSYKRGYDWGAWMNQFFDWVNNLFNPDKPKKGQPAMKDQLFYHSANTVPFTKTPNITQQRVDTILDKISQKGYNSLSEEEKELLKRASQEGH